VEKPSEVSGEIVAFFRNHFAEPSWRRPQLDGVEFPSLSPIQLEGLVKPFSVEEVIGLWKMRMVIKARVRMVLTLHF
jgi:hypothetical protein